MQATVLDRGASTDLGRWLREQMGACVCTVYADHVSAVVSGGRGPCEHAEWVMRLTGLREVRVVSAHGGWTTIGMVPAGFRLAA